jgi:hypothetical protein
MHEAAVQRPAAQRQRPSALLCSLPLRRYVCLLTWRVSRRGLAHLASTSCSDSQSEASHRREAGGGRGKSEIKHRSAFGRSTRSFPDAGGLRPTRPIRPAISSHTVTGHRHRSEPLTHEIENTIGSRLAATSRCEWTQWRAAAKVVPHGTQARAGTTFHEATVPPNCGVCCGLVDDQSI